MSILLGTGVLVAAGVVHAATNPRKLTAVQKVLRRQEWIMGGALERIVGVEQTEVIRTCEPLTQCAWDRAITNSYDRCQEAGGQVGMVCNGTTKVIEVAGKVVSKVINLF